MDKKNVIVIMADQLKATALGMYGNPFCITPSLDRMAQEGTVCRNAFTPHPLCVPARVSLWTSQYPHTHGSRRNETLMKDGSSHAFNIWKNAGYKTGLIGKNHCFQSAEDLNSFDVWCEIDAKGFKGCHENRGMNWPVEKELIEEAHSVKQNMPMQSRIISYAFSDYPTEHYSSGVIADQTVRFIENNKDNPFALWVSFPDPHTPFEAPSCFARLYNEENLELPPRKQGEFNNAPERNKVLKQMLDVDLEPEKDLYKTMAAYYGNISFVDEGVGKILDALERLSLREDTIVVFCADHGDFCGEHGMINKGGLFYDCLTRIPILFSCPGSVAESVVDESMINLIDVVPTILNLQGFDVPGWMQGKGVPLLTSDEPRNLAVSEYGAGGKSFSLNDLKGLSETSGFKPFVESLQWREAEGRRKMIRTKEWKYVHDPLGDKDELYHMEQDPWELENLIDEEEYKEIAIELKSELLDWSILQEDPHPVELPLEEFTIIPGLKLHS